MKRTHLTVFVFLTSFIACCFYFIHSHPSTLSVSANTPACKQCHAKYSCSFENKAASYCDIEDDTDNENKMKEFFILHFLKQPQRNIQLNFVPREYFRYAHSEINKLILFSIFRL
jgi:hypothetical protein